MAVEAPFYNGQKHFIPFYYPNGKYFVRFIKGDFWTPAGALNVSVNSEPINIKGNACLFYGL